MKLKQIITEMNYKKEVIKKYPNAYAQKMKSGKIKGLEDVFYYIYPKFNDYRIGYGKTINSAWEDAYKKMNMEPFN